VTDEPFDLTRFVTAQDRGGAYRQALRELQAGAKRGHWMWFVFPQVAGLGHSPTSQLYAVSGLVEARAYLAHPVLGPRLVECSRAVDDLDTRDPVSVLGSIDALKLRSSMTLFERAASENLSTTSAFASVLDHYYDGRRDDATLGILGG
jgi:uncharacterized protein (DUF1810 family)